jgi:HlyD family secretion protein
MKKVIVIVILLAAIGGAGGAYYMRMGTKEPEVRTTQITRGDVVEAVQATGTLEAVTTVQVGTQVGGIVQDLYADFNDIVKQGQVIARLDPTILDTQIEQQRANVTRSQADLERLRVTLADAQQKLERAKALFEKSLLPRTELETAEVTVKSAEAQIRSSEAGLVQAKSQLNTAQVNRQHTVITAPIDGIVIQRSVELGQTVNAGMSAPTLYILAADLTKMQVNANIDEADVGKMRPGQTVLFRVDAFVGEQFTGTVQQVRLQPTTVQNVVTYQTVIDVPNQQLKLKPGMTATVTIEISRKNNVLRIPAAATRFRPTVETFAALKQEPPPDLGRGGFGGRGRNAGGGTPGTGGPSATPSGAPPAAAAARPSGGPTQQATVTPQRQGERSRSGPAPENGAGGTPGTSGVAAPGEGAEGARGGFGGGRGGFDSNLTPEQREERRKRLEERMAALTPEERAAFQERMAQRGQSGGERGGFGGAQAPGVQAPGGGRGGSRPGQPGTSPQAASNQARARGAGMGRVASTPSMSGTATTIDSLFGPLPVVETRGAAWLWENKQLKQVRLRLGASDGTNIEVIEATPEVREGAEVVTNIITDQVTTAAPGGNNANNPLLGPQRGRRGPGRGGG